MAPLLTLSESELTELVASFENGTIDNCEFSHPAHIHVIWSLVRSRGTLGGVAQFERCLKRIMEAEGHPEKYHATITYALGILVGERVAADPHQNWDDFMASNADVFEWPSGLLTELYPNDELESPESRARFIPPSG